MEKLIEKEIIEKLQSLFILNTYLDLDDETREIYTVPRKTLKKWFENSKKLLDLFNNEQKISHHLQGQLDIANAKNIELFKEKDILKTNYEILQGEMDRVGIDTLGLEKGSSTDDVIDTIKNLQKEIEELKDYQNRTKHTIAIAKMHQNNYKAIEEKLNEIKNYVIQEIQYYDEDIEDYIDDDKIGNKNIIDNLKEDREHWKDVLKIIERKNIEKTENEQ